MVAYAVFGIRNIEGGPDGDLFQAYVQAALPTTAGHDVKLLAGPEPGYMLEGERLEKTVMLEFPTRAEAEAWYYGDYQRAKAMREKISECFAFIIESSS